MPTYNGARHLGEALRSIVTQKGPRFELVVCDDRSDDATEAVVRELLGDSCRFERNAERLGLAGNWNRCVELSRTPLVAIVHQDDQLLPGHLEGHVRAFEGDPTLGLVASHTTVIDAEGLPVPESVVGRGGLGPVDRDFAPGAALPELAVGNPLRCSAVTVRAEAHARLGGFDPSYRYVVDWDFWARVAETWGVAWRARPTVAVRWHPASETHVFKTGVIDLEETERLLARLSPFASDARASRLAHARLSRAYLNRAQTALKAGDGSLSQACLKRAINLSTRTLFDLATDPRLALQMAAVSAAPGPAGRWFGPTR